MKISYIIKTFLIIISFSSISTYASEFTDKDEAWYFSIHSGQMTFDDTSDIFLADFSMDDSYLAGFSLGKELYYLNPDFTLDLEAQFFKHFENQDHEEYNLLAMLKWKNLNWFGNIKSSFAIGNGISYASEIPTRELQVQGSDGSNDLLNYVVIDKSFQIPNYDNYEISFRYHHRSGVLGLYDNAREGSTAFLVGVRYKFNY